MNRTLRSLRIATVACAAVVALAFGAAPALAKAADSNHNGIPNSWEAKYHLSKHKNQAKSDFDKDGLNNLNEYRAGTNPRKKDSDGDHIPDGSEDRDRDGLPNLAEVRAKTSIRVADTDRDGVLDSNEDPDRDGLDNDEEWDCRTNPLAADSDHDGVRDDDEDADHDGLDNESECAEGDDPRDADSDDDGVEDGDELGGYVLSFEASTGALTVRPFRSDAATFVVTVNAETVIEWDGDGDHEDGHDVEGESAASLSDIVTGAIVKDIETTRLADGTLLATKMEIKRREAEELAIAEIESFDASSGVLYLESDGDDDLEYAVVVDSSTVIEWLGVTSTPAPGPADLTEDTKVAVLETTTDSSGTLRATRIVLIPHDSRDSEHDRDED